VSVVATKLSGQIKFVVVVITREPINVYKMGVNAVTTRAGAVVMRVFGASYFVAISFKSIVIRIIVVAASSVATNTTNAAVFAIARSLASVVCVGVNPCVGGIVAARIVAVVCYI
jgi:hypothetical protein